MTSRQTGDEDPGRPLEAAETVLDGIEGAHTRAVVAAALVRAFDVPPELIGLCGTRGSSDVAYCACVQPAGHWPGTTHRCQHGAWF